MKKIILQNSEYSFNASTKQVTLLAHTDLLNKENLLLITNTTQNQIIYNFGCEGYGGTINEISKVVTLEYDTSSMLNSDRLQIILYTEQDDSDSTIENLLVVLNSSVETLGCIRELLEINNKLLKKILS